MIQNCQTQHTELTLKPTSEVHRSDVQEVSELTLGALFDAEETPLLRYAFSLTGRRAVAEEIVQEVFLRLHVHWDEVESPRAWLFRSVRNRACDHLRTSRRETTQCDEASTPPLNREDETPETLLLRMEATGTLRQAMEELDEADQQLVKLKYFDDLKYRDISVQTGLSIGNVGYRLHHILKGLAAKLRPLGIDQIL